MTHKVKTPSRTVSVGIRPCLERKRHWDSKGSGMMLTRRSRISEGWIWGALVATLVSKWGGEGGWRNVEGSPGKKETGKRGMLSH